MSLQKKIIFGFLISTFIISILAAFEYLNFIQVRNEMSFLELSDTVRSKSLQLRRHEKNFFLFPDKAAEESAQTRDYLDQLDDLTANVASGDPGKIAALRSLVAKYRGEFAAIEVLIADISQGFESTKADSAGYGNVFPLIESDSRDKPLQVAQFLENSLSLPPENPQVDKLKELDTEINNLRDTGENILTASKELDTDARANADRGISVSQIAVVGFFPIFLISGLGALFFIGIGVVKRLKTLTDAVDKIGERYAPGPAALAPRNQSGSRKDEVDILVDKFNNMNTQLMEWEEELDNKNQELLQSKKLAAIGTLAAGVAHELNNPLNNINVSVQVLQKQLQGDESPVVNEIISDILGQTLRVKGIVGNLLEFAREREPQMAEVNLKSIITNAYGLVGRTIDTGRINFIVDSDVEDVTLRADPNQMERVFVNLFSNAVTAMDGEGQLAVQIKPGDDKKSLRIYVSDTGRGIPAEDREKIFDPFFTKREKGTGLGLAIVMNTVNKHNGHISVVSEEGMGTVFEILLPRGND